ncbi:hypothetical protein DL766_000800 [Monosporascus sp. MC13-8B]|uniref:lytic cellulose monooxygenase (C4-dehydrogenating) n=1 Tax=Monosporascus cannonballus TaxID=155416 RepID=A0ABY0HHB1_9PEZI|nr:hypothetical protein DL762_001109 [Monosporascus cannonballus]RYO98386.1 hypothetical protein DL763_002225 [Monosporascus cannonballus]RYP38800.1 hypothetical protein DL766_000800 [Monosporascus sp. MC13-8B]
MSFRSAIALTGAFATAVMAHGRIEGISIDGTFVPAFKGSYFYENKNTGSFPDNVGWYAENTDNGFVAPNEYNTAAIICHKNARPGAIAAKASAGSTVSFHWNKDWPDSHMGPILNYVAEYTGSPADIDPTALKWVKVDEAGYDAATKTFASPAFMANNATYDMTIPSNLKAGKYVFRHEIIALHGAGQENGAQNYPQCFNIDVTGSGTELPEGTPGTKLYTSTEPGILFNPYQNIQSYEMPGPALFAAGGSGSSPAPAPISSAAPTPTAPTPTAPTVEVTPSATAAPTSSAIPAPTNVPGGSATLPEQFTIEQFINWLQTVTGSSNARRHARQMLRRRGGQL